ncbi:MAG: trigger factor [Bacteroidetes bacterium]|nr:MAG: trigger factor [Bacteroidota bacterium]
MNVTTKKTDDLNAILTVSIKEEDYREVVDKTLSDYRKKANIPGFRPGKVPAGLVKKQFGKAILIEEVNKILQQSVFDHIKKEELNILGSPLPVEQDDIDWDSQGDFDFNYELGLSPSFELNISARTKIPFLKVVADEAMVNRYITDYARRFGTMSYPQTIEVDAILKGDFVELADDSSAKEGGITVSTTLALDAFADTTQKELTGKAVGDTAEFTKESFKDDFRLAGVLKVDEEVLAESSYKFSFTLTELSKIVPAELNQELFDKIFGEGVVKSEEEFKARIKEDAEKVFVGDSDRKFLMDVKENLLEKTKFDLPETFLKKWMRTSGEKPLTEEEVEEQFPNMKEDMRWQIMQNRIISENKIEVNHQELVEFTKQLVLQQMAQYGQMPEGVDLDQIAHNVLGNREEAERIGDQLFERKLLEYFKSSFKIEEKELTYDEFVKELYAK